MSKTEFAFLFACASLISFGSGCSAPAPEADVASSDADLFGLGENPQMWRALWDARYASSLDFPIEAAQPMPAFTGTHTVLLVPGTSVGPELFGPMAARLRRDGFDVVVWAPPDLFTDSLWKGAALLADEVQTVLASRGETQLDIVAECDGGVAARYYTNILGGDRYVNQLVTFVSAHHGTETAPVGAWLTGWGALADIKPSSVIIAKLDAAPMPAGLKMTSIYTCHDQYLTPYTTSRVEGATNVEFCGTWIGHFDGFWNLTVYDRILATLRGEGDSAPTSY